MGRGKLNPGPQVSEGGVTNINCSAFEYTISSGSTKSLHMHLGAQHIERSHEDIEMANTGPGWIPAPLVEEEDRDRLLNTKTSKQHAPRSAYQSFLVRKERER
jgi:hypothetical protein